MLEPRMPDQRALLDQLKDVYKFAIEEGMYDAADWIKRMLDSTRPHA